MEIIVPTHAVKAVIKNEHGEILFLQRNASGRADMKSNWDLPGGLVEESEDDRTALAREIVEELSRQAVIGHMIGTWTFYRSYDGATVRVTNYAAELDTADLGELTLSEEHIRARWVSRAALSEIEVKDRSIFTALGLE